MKDGTRRGNGNEWNALLGGGGQPKPGSRAGPGGSAKATRQRFTPQYKLSLVERADACETPGEIGRLLRRGAVQFTSVGSVEGGPGGFGDSPQHILRLVQDRGVAGLADRHSGAGVRWNRIPDTVRQRVVDKADEVRREAS